MSDQPTPEEIRRDIEQTRDDLGDTVEALAAKTDVKAQAHARVEEVKENMAGIREDAAAKARDLGGRASEATPDSAGSALARLRTLIAENPLPFAVGAALAIGFLVGRR